MPNFDFKEPDFKEPKTLQQDWTSFQGGLNTLLRQNEIKDTELAQMDNIKLVGKGVPTKREGTANYFLTAPSVATGTERVRGLKGVKFASGASGVNELLAVSDWGFLVKKANASYAMVQGYSYASGYPMEMAQVYNNVYLSNFVDPLTKYDGATIYPYTALSRVTNITATNLSGVSGTFTRSFRISALSAVGETLASPIPVAETAVLVQNTPQDLADTTIRLEWTNASPASTVVGYNVYGFNQGDETFITSIPSNGNTTLRYDYVGVPEPSTLALTPAADTTAGPKAKYMISYKDKIILGNLDGRPSAISWSGGGPNVDKFNWRYGGGNVDISKDDGDQIMGLIEFQDAVIVFKERSIWKVTFEAQGALVIPTVELIIRGVGCVSHRTIKHVENDVFFLSRKGIFTFGNEANYLNVLRTNELSSRVRTAFQGLEMSQSYLACAVYQDSKYRLAYPTDLSGYNKKEIVYDRERTAWVGPNTYPAVPGIYDVYFDGANQENLVWGDSNDNFVTEFSDGYVNDKGVKIQTSLLTKKTAFKNPFRFKQIKEVFSNWRNLSGSPFVSVILEQRDGTFATAESFSITASSAGVGWGFDNFGAVKWGNTNGAGSAEASSDLVRRTRLNKIARAMQIQITTTGNNDRYELLGFQNNAQELGKGVIPSSWDTS